MSSYLWKVTAKRNVGKLPAGASVEIVKQNTTAQPNANEITVAFANLFMLMSFSRLRAVLLGILFLISNISFQTAAQNATWVDNGAYSITWYKKNQSTFDISTPQELAGIAYLVNNNFADFSGKTINIISDIDLAGKNWVPIGLGSSIFKGNIEGNNHTIDNIKINSGTSDAAGFCIYMQYSRISNLNFRGTLNVNKNYLGFIAYKATSSNFENISISCSLTFSHSVSRSTDFVYSSLISGMIAEATNCTFSDIRVKDNISYTFGDARGSSCYGKISLYAGGIVAKSYNSTFTKCHAINQFIATINGYLASNSYTSPGDSFIQYGGIVGYLTGSSSKVIGCLVENILFEGRHPVGNYDTKKFGFGGVVGLMGDDTSALKNCVAMNDSYNIYGHDPSWVASYYHTNSYFGGVAYSASKNFAGCYSNNDVSKTISKCLVNLTEEDGSTSFSKNQMCTQSFVDELNFYSQLEFDEDYWELKDGKLCIKHKNINSGIDHIEVELPDTYIYTVQGVYVGNSMDNLTPGIYIVRSPKTSSKIVVR